MAEAQVRDDISDLITMTGYQASTLTGGQELLSRTIPSVNNISANSAIGSSLTFRVMSSSGRTLMRSKVLMCFPLKFDQLATRDSLGFLAAAGQVANANVAHAAGQHWDAAGHRNICPRKSAALQMCRQSARVLAQGNGWSPWMIFLEIRAITCFPAMVHRNQEGTMPSV